MYFKRALLACVCVLTLAVRPATAQLPFPFAGAGAIGASIGATIPTDASLRNGLDVGASLEGYLTPRVSVRGQFGAAWWDITGRGFTGTIKPVFFTGNLIYNWDGGIWHPYATAGAGAYRFRSDINPSVEGSNTSFGVNLGGGIEYFLAADVTITAEALYHKVGEFASPVAEFGSGSFLSFAIGAKKYF